MRLVAAIIFSITGLAAVLYGTSLVYPPAAMVLSGAVLFCVGMFLIGAE